MRIRYLVLVAETLLGARASCPAHADLLSSRARGKMPALQKNRSPFPQQKLLKLTWTVLTLEEPT